MVSRRLTGMENENSNEASRIKDDKIDKNEKNQVKSDANNDKRMSVLKQLDNKKLYPVQERVGIYMIAALSFIGLVLIGYTGVMAISLNAPPLVNDEAEVVDAGEVHELLEEIALEGDLTEDETSESSEEDIEPNDEESDSDEEESTTETSEVTTATVTEDLINLRRDLVSGETILALNTGDVVEIIDFETNRYWVEVAYDSSDFGRVEGFVPREFLDY